MWPEHAPGVPGHVRHNSKLRGSECYELSRAFYLASIYIDHKVANLKYTALFHAFGDNRGPATEHRVSLGKDEPGVGIELQAGIGAGHQAVACRGRADMGQECNHGNAGARDVAERVRGGGCIGIPQPGHEIKLARDGEVDGTGRWGTFENGDATGMKGAHARQRLGVSRRDEQATAELPGRCGGVHRVLVFCMLSGKPEVESKYTCNVNRVNPYLWNWPHLLPETVRRWQHREPPQAATG